MGPETEAWRISCRADLDHLGWAPLECVIETEG